MPLWAATVFLGAPLWSDRIGEGDRLAGALGVGDLPARRLSDVPARIDDQDPIVQVDLAQVKCVQDCLLLRRGGLVRFARGDDDDSGEAQLRCRRSRDD